MDEFIRKIKKTREYLDYIEEHFFNVQKAWDILKNNCYDMKFIYDDFYYFTIDEEIKNHDLSKLSEHEFIQYRKAFYPTETEDKYDMSEAWEYHKKENKHHWQTWTNIKFNNPFEWEIHCVHMICDWMAMGFKFNDTAKEYYENNKDKIKLPDYAINYIYKIFNRIY